MFHLDTLATLVAATLTLLLGRKLVHSVSFLKKYTIPEPVAGGLLVALALLVLKKSMGWEVNFDMSLRDPLMLAFFATIGLNANIASLRAGGRVVGIFLIVVVGLLVMQNAIGIGMASLLGLDPLMGLLAGSITLSGGHGTGAAWSKLFIERYGFTNATEVAMACATFGLVLGGLIGGPVARYLVKHSTTPNGIPDDQEVPTAFEKPDVGRMITSLVLIETIALIAICLTVGKIVAQLLAGTAFELPTFVCVLFVGVILSNGLSIMGFYRVFERAVSVLGNVSLSLFLAMAAGYALAWFMGMLPESNEPMTQELIMVPTPLYYGLGIEWSLLLPLMLVFMITSLETIGDITATSDVSEQPVSGPLYMKRLKGGVLANGLNSFVSAVFNTFPNSCFGQNNGVIQLTGVASRYVGFVVALMLIVLGLFPAVSGFVQHIPEPVLGGATLVMFGTIAASGVRIVSREPLNRRAILIIALSLAVGLGVSQQPLILQFAPEWLKNLLSSGIAAGGITAIVLNLIFPPEKQ